MSERDHSKQVARRQRIGETTLVVGVDIGSAFNAVGFMSKEGKVLGSYPIVKRTELTIKDIEREIKRMLKDIPQAEYLLLSLGSELFQLLSF